MWHQWVTEIGMLFIFCRNMINDNLKDWKTPEDNTITGDLTREDPKSPLPQSVGRKDPKSPLSRSVGRIFPSRFSLEILLHSGSLTDSPFLLRSGRFTDPHSLAPSITLMHLRAMKQGSNLIDTFWCPDQGSQGNQICKGSQGSQGNHGSH